MFINGNFLEDPVTAPSPNRIPLNRDFEQRPDARIMTPFRQFQLEDSFSSASGDEAAPDTPVVAIAEHPNNEPSHKPHKIQHAPQTQHDEHIMPETRQHDEHIVPETRQLQIPVNRSKNLAIQRNMKFEKNLELFQT